jgi:hypothetical protein
MSSPRKCAECGQRYEDFRSGLSFADAKAEMWSGSDDPSDWRSKSRKAVLGYMHERKRALWDEWHGAGRCVEAAGEFEVGGGGAAVEWELVPF